MLDRALLRNVAWGCLAGAAPPVLKFAAVCASIQAFELPSAGFLAGSALLTAVGGFAAWALTGRETRVVAALLAGAAVPALIAVGLSDYVENSRLSRVSLASLVNSPARAEQPADGNHAAETVAYRGGSVLVISPRVDGELPTVPLSVSAEVISPSGDRRLADIGEITSFSAPTAFTLPAGTRTVYIAGHEVDGLDLDSPVQMLDLALSTVPTESGDFLWALGLKREYEIFGMAFGVQTQMKAQDQGVLENS